MVFGKAIRHQQQGVNCVGTQGLFAILACFWKELNPQVICLWCEGKKNLYL